MFYWISDDHTTHTVQLTRYPTKNRSSGPDLNLPHPPVLLHIKEGRLSIKLYALYVYTPFSSHFHSRFHFTNETVPSFSHSAHSSPPSSDKSCTRCKNVNFQEGHVHFMYLWLLTEFDDLLCLFFHPHTKCYVSLLPSNHLAHQTVRVGLLHSSRRSLWEIELKNNQIMHLLMKKSVRLFLNLPGIPRPLMYSPYPCQAARMKKSRWRMWWHCLRIEET